MNTTKIPTYLFLEILAYVLLLIAALIYAFWREPNTYFAFLLYKIFGLNQQNNFFATISTHHQWLIYNLPSALWILATTLLGKLAYVDGKLFVYSPIFLVLIIEFFQFCKITDGVFDWLDVAVSVIGFLIARILPIKIKEYQKKRWKLVYWFCILVLPLSDVM